MQTYNDSAVSGRARGFTLLELLLALVVFSLAASLFYQHATLGASYHSQLRDQQQARWLVQHHLALMTASQASAEPLPLLFNQTIYYHTAGRDWQLLVTAQPTEIENWQRLQFTVALQAAANQPLITYHRFWPLP